jgi:hypothetical protein
LATLLAFCVAAGFRPHKHADKDVDGNTHNDLRIIGGSKSAVCALMELLSLCIPQSNEFGALLF